MSEKMHLKFGDVSNIAAKDLRWVLIAIFVKGDNE